MRKLSPQEAPLPLWPKIKAAGTFAPTAAQAGALCRPTQKIPKLPGEPGFGEFLPKSVEANSCFLWIAGNQKRRGLGTLLGGAGAAPDPPTRQQRLLWSQMLGRAEVQSAQLNQQWKGCRRQAAGQPAELTLRA